MDFLRIVISLMVVLGMNCLLHAEMYPNGFKCESEEIKNKVRELIETLNEILARANMKQDISCTDWPVGTQEELYRFLRDCGIAKGRELIRIIDSNSPNNIDPEMQRKRQDAAKEYNAYAKECGFFGKNT